MKNFIKTLFAVIFGNAIFFGIFFLMMILLVIGVGMSSDSDSKETISTNSVLKLSLKGPLTELSEKSDMNFNFGGSKDEEPMSIHDLISSINQAKDDSKINALWIDLNFNESMSYAQVDLIRQAIQNFKTSKKPVIAYGEVVSQKMYYLASSADKIYVNPHGGMDLRGFGAQISFIKNTLDKLEIQPQIFYAGKFKSATEPLRLTQMSEENKQQTRELLTDISEIVLTNIAKDRKISRSELDLAFNQLKSNMPADALNSKLIDGAKFHDEVVEDLKKTLKLNSDYKLEATPVKTYISSVLTEKATSEIAVYIAEGDIIDGKTNAESIGSETVAKDLREIRDNDEIKALVLRVNSPGGSALASAVMLREIELIKKKKPVIVSMGNLAASGGYYISSYGSKIFAEPNTITGSIGVFGIIPNMSNLLKNKLGLTFDEVELHEHAVMGVNKSLESTEAAKIQLEVEHTYNTFKSEVSKGRKISMDSVEALAQGRVWSGSRAKNLGLVDELGTLQDAIAYTAKLIKSDATNYYFFNHRKTELEELIENFSSKALVKLFSDKILKESLGDFLPYFNQFKAYQSVRQIRAAMFYQVKI